MDEAQIWRCAMKRNRLFSGALALALVLSLTTVPAFAATFPDVPAGYWAESYINDMAEQGVFKGYDNGEFRPKNELQGSEALALCARIAVETDLRAQIGKDRADDISAIMGDQQSWFRDEYATCLEAGILSYTELKGLYDSGALDNGKTITKEDFALYLVRAMQLAPMAEHLSSYTLTFTDKADITPGREPYIYLLNTYGIITGTDQNQFQPKSTVTREVAATMLSRAIAFMEERGTSVELPNYTDYEWQAGTIVSATSSSKNVIVLTLNSDLSGSCTISLPADTPIYENSMLVDSALLQTGTYARVCYDEDGTPMAVRLSGKLDTVAGTVVGVSDSEILLNVNGASMTLPYDRFTEVQVGQKVGGYELIDTDAGYTTAVCRVDQQGHLAAVQLSGGTRKAEGLISAVETQASGGSVVTISGFDGQLERLTVPAGTAITANGLAVSGMSASYVGSYVSLRASNDNGNVTTAAVDTVTQYIQGAVKSVGSASGGVNNVTITDLKTNKATTYNFASDAVVTYNGKASTVSGVQKDWFVTVRLSGGEVTMLSGYPGSSVTEGTITDISYPTGTTTEVISVTTADGRVVPFQVDLSDPPQVRRSDKPSSIDKLRTGDAVTVTVRYNAVTLIDSVPQSANVSGTITRKSEDTSGITIEVELDNNGGTATYTITSGVSVSQDGKLISMYDLRVGYHVAMVTNGDSVASIEVDKTTTSSSQLTGTVIYVNTSDRTITFRADDGTGSGSVIQVSVPSNTVMQDAAGGSFSLLTLKTGDALNIYGGYTTSGEFKASIIVRTAK